MNLVSDFIRSCRKTAWRQRLVDSAGTRLSGAGVLVRTLVLRRILLRDVLARDEQVEGILLPPSVAGALANFALTLAGRVVVNLNYTLRSDQMNSCIRQAASAAFSPASAFWIGCRSPWRPSWCFWNRYFPKCG